jgi:hypothetical protein
MEWPAPRTGCDLTSGGPAEVEFLGDGQEAAQLAELDEMIAAQWEVLPPNRENAGRGGAGGCRQWWRHDRDDSNEHQDAGTGPADRRPYRPSGDRWPATDATLTVAGSENMTDCLQRGLEHRLGIVYDRPSRWRPWRKRYRLNCRNCDLDLPEPPGLSSSWGMTDSAWPVNGKSPS